MVAVMRAWNALTKPAHVEHMLGAWAAFYDARLA